MDVEHGKTWIEIDGLQLNSSQLDLGPAGTAAKIADVAVTLEAAPAQAKRIAELEAALQTYANHDNWTAGVAPSNNPRIFSHPADRFGPPWNIAEQALAGAEEEA